MTFPAVRLGVAIEFFINGAWLDVTNLRPTYNCYVQGLDGKKAVVINRAKKSGLPLITNLVTFTFVDTDAIMDNDNPLSPYYQKLGPGTQIRIKVDGAVRMTVALVSMVPDFDDAPRVITVAVTATGQYDQFVEGTKSTRSPVRRQIDALNARAYWPLEESKDATQANAVTLNTKPLTRTRSTTDPMRVVFGDSSLLVGSLPIARTSTKDVAAALGPGGWPFLTALAGNADGVNPTGWSIGCWIIINRSSATGLEASYALQWGGLPTGSPLRGWELTVFYDASTPLNNAVTVNMGLNNYVTSSIDITDGVPHFLMVTAEQVSANNVKIWLYVDGVADDTGSNPNPATPFTLVPVSNIYVGSENETLATDQWIGHVCVFDRVLTPAEVLNIYTAGRGNAGESAGARIARVLTEESIPYTILGTSASTALMGPQPITTVPEVILDCAKVDNGMLYEAIDTLGFTYRTRDNMYTQSPSLRLSHASSHLSPPFQAVMGGIMDNTIINDMTTKRPSGSSGRVIIPDGDFFHWSTEAPPLGVGRRDGSQDVNVYTDNQLDDHSGWIAHVASWREKRIADVTVMRQRRGLSTDPTTSAAVLALGIMDLIAINTTGAPKWLPQDEVRLLAEGYNEEIAQYNHTFRIYTRPADPYEVTEMNSSGSALVMPMTLATTSIKIETSLGPKWSLTDTPYHIQAGGEAMRATAMFDDAPAFIAAGTVAHGNNASVTPGLPAGMTPGVGQLMILQVAIRNSGGGTVNIPAGWTSIADVGRNHRILGKYYVTGDVAPTVTFAGGVLNADTSARIMAWSGLSMQLGGYATGGSGTKQAPNSVSSLNGVLQDIAYAGLTVFRDNCVVFYFGWKQDAWTSVATIAGAVEAWENTTITGDDQGIVADYVIQGAKANIPAGSFVVTGGITAISRAFVLALRPTQTAVVTRNVNNVNVTHVTGEAVRGWRMGVNGL